LNKKPRGLARKSMAEISSEELCGAATMSSSFEELCVADIRHP